MSYETPEEYAQRRANETRRVYVVTANGNVFCMVGNRDAIELCGGVVATFRPRGRR